MKSFHTLLLSATLLCGAALPTLAQIQVGSNKVGMMGRPGKLDPADLDDLRSTTTVFTLPDADMAMKNQYEAAIGKVWKLTKFKVASRQEGMRLLGQPGYSAFVLGGWTVQRGNSVNTHLAYDLVMMKEGRGDRLKPEYFARIILHPDPETVKESMRSLNRRNGDESMADYLYEQASFANLNPGMLAGYLKEVNDRLAEGSERGAFESTSDDQAPQALRRDTLFVPDYVLTKMNMFTGAERADDNDDADDDLAKAYPFPVKVVSTADINRRILAGGKPIYYLVYVRSSTDKFVCVYESGKGRLLYAQYSPASYNFKMKDLSRLAKMLR